MGINPIKLIGNWDDGYALDKHILQSIPLGEDNYGHMLFDTTRSKMGELVYQFKYQNNYDKLMEIMELAIPFLDTWNVLQSVNAIIPVPSSKKDRIYQPAYEIADQIAGYLGINCYDNVLQKVSGIQAKGMTQEEKSKIKGTIIATKKGKRQYNVLLVNDLYQSGTTLHECVNALREDKNHIYVLAMTKTKR
jgi:predicted amidophosphoribosyltransferase